jgi:hypothetical protein
LVIRSIPKASGVKYGFQIKFQISRCCQTGVGLIEFKGIQMNTHYFWQKNFNIYACI